MCVQLLTSTTSTAFTAAHCLNRLKLHTPIKLFHLGRKEIDGMLSLMEDRWDDLMTFHPQLFGQPGAVPSYTSDPSQKFGVRSTMPKSTPPKKLEQIQNQESESYLMESVYELKACQQ